MVEVRFGIDHYQKEKYKSALALTTMSKHSILQIRDLGAIEAFS
jgi:hypothetical protein